MSYVMHEEDFEHKGRTFTMEVTQEYCSETPWDWCDGHGEVSDWTTRDKKPGELVLCQDGRSKRYYDFAGAMKKAKAEGWDAEPYKTGSAGERAYRAVMSDFKHLKDWCDDKWSYVVVGVKHGEHEQYLGMVEFSYYDTTCALECAHELANEIIYELDKEAHQAHVERRWADAQNLGILEAA